MKVKQISLALALVLAMGGLVSGCAPEHAGTDAHADHADAIATAGGTDFPVPANHVRWTPDAPLVEGMSRVRTALAGLEAESHPDDASVAALATEIDSAVEYMFANCTLDTEPDIALHALLARLMADTRALEANPSDGSPVADMHDTLHNYAQLFDDPNGEA